MERLGIELERNLEPDACYVADGRAATSSL